MTRFHECISERELDQIRAVGHRAAAWMCAGSSPMPCRCCCSSTGFSAPVQPLWRSFPFHFSMDSGGECDWRANASILCVVWDLTQGRQRALNACPMHAHARRAAVILSACRGKLVDMKPPKAFGPLSVRGFERWSALMPERCMPGRAKGVLMLIARICEPISPDPRRRTGPSRKSGLRTFTRLARCARWRSLAPSSTCPVPRRQPRWALGCASGALPRRWTCLSLSNPLLSPSQLSLLALVAFEFHLVRRYLETTVLMRYPPTARMHGIAYVYGLRQGGVGWCMIVRVGGGTHLCEGGSVLTARGAAPWC